MNKAYWVVKEEKLLELEKKVNELISVGFAPTGGLSQSITTYVSCVDRKYYLQAMYKQQERKNNE